MGKAIPVEKPVPQPAPEKMPPLFERIYEQYSARIYNYCRYRLGDRDRADDAVSAIFEKVLMNLDRYDPSRGLVADWLFAIARNAVRDQVRQRRRRTIVSLEAIPERASTAPSPEDSALESDRRGELLDAVSRLSGREREVVALKFAGGLSNQSIARLCRLTPGNVAVILCRALRRIRCQLEREEGIP